MSDLISRQAVLDALGERPLTWTGGDYELGCRNQYDEDRLAIEAVPSVQYVISMLGGEGYKCSECGFECVPYWHFCPNCGADMRGIQDA